MQRDSNFGPIWEEAEAVPTQEGFISINEAKRFFINLFNKLLLNTHYVPGPELEKELSETQPLSEVAHRSGSERHRGKWSLKVCMCSTPTSRTHSFNKSRWRT